MNDKGGRMWIVLFMLLIVGCSQQNNQSSAMSHEFGVSTPVSFEWERTYTVPLVDGFVVVMEAHSYSSNRRYWGYAKLIEPSGRYVLFSHTDVAGKVLVSELVPKVERAVKLILDLDEQFMESERSEIVDSEGHRWLKVKGGS